jgi:predicted nuclease with TOPRIM domain
LKIIESLQKKQGKNQAKKKELGPNLKILKNENSRLKDAIRKKKTYKTAKDKN